MTRHGLRCLSVVLLTLSVGTSGTLCAGSPAFTRGDINADLEVDVSDAVYLLGHLFAPIGTTPNPIACADAADVNDDESLDVADAVNLLSYLFIAGPPPAAPFPDCATDPTDTGLLSCDSYPTCGAPPSALADVAHVLRRAGFGPTPTLLEEVAATGVEAYLAGQLDGSVDDAGNTTLDDVMAGLQPYEDIEHLYRSQFALAILSRQQLRETLTDFWENHFNTYIFKIRNHFRNLEGPAGEDIYTSDEGNVIAAYLEATENQLLRDKALGSFHDLLLASATGVPMLIYLDSIQNISADANENYAREVLELHTMGDDNGYNQDDVEELARCFTGWTIARKAPADVGDPLAPTLPVTDDTGEWSFHFDSANHDYDAKTIFEGTFYQIDIPAIDPLIDPDAGLQDGLIVLEWLAKSSTQTAEFISTKLIQKFVNETPPPALLANCIGTWLATEGDMHAVITTILESPEFLGTDHRMTLVKTPFEYMMASVRALNDGSVPASTITDLLPDARNQLSRLGNRPFTWNDPDGYPPFGVDQLGTSHLMERMRFNLEVYFEEGAGYGLDTLLTTRGVDLSSEVEIATAILGMLYPGLTDSIDLELSVDFLSRDVSGSISPLDPTAPDFAERLQQFCAFAVSFPQSFQQ